MCLNPICYNNYGSPIYRHAPANDSKIRWKVLYVGVNQGGKKSLESLYRECTWHVGSVKRAANDGTTNDRNCGIHVFVDRLDAKTLATDWSPKVFVKLEVSSFIAGGYWREKACETWKRAKILQVYTPEGKNITRQFR